MLPVYKAIQFKEIINRGSRNNPWVVFVRTPEGIKPYVVKLFDTEFIDYKDCVTNEVLGNILASEFDLNTPKAAFIDFDSSFINGITRLDLLEVLERKDQRLKFATELLEGIVQFDNSVFSSVEAREIIDIDTLFGYDNLIRNIDRTRKPANLLIKEREAFLIDHELAFDLKGHPGEELRTWLWDKRFWEDHIFRSYLKKSWTSFKLEYFNPFEEYLRTLRVSLLKPYFKQLVKEGYSDKNHDPIANYLSEMKKNSSKFVNILKAKIS